MDGPRLRTCKAVGYADILAVVLAQQDADYSFPGALCGAAIVISDREEDEGSD
jgi:hypothetical protein